MFWVYRYKGFSFTAARTVHTALVLAGQQGCSQADTGHLLLALVQTAQGTAADFLRRKRVTSTALAEHTAAHAAGRPRRLHSRDLAPELSKAMEFAVLGAHAASAARAENEHLLCAILEDSSCTASRWLAALGIELPQDVVDYISENITNNVRQIEGTVKKIKAYHDLTGMPLDITNVSRAIKDMYKGKTQAIPTPDLIISEVCRFYSIDESTLRSTLKNKGTAEARQVAMYLIRKLTNLSLPDIAKEFGKNHTTVLYALKKVEQELPNSSNGLQDNIRDITSNINSRL